MTGRVLSRISTFGVFFAVVATLGVATHETASAVDTSWHEIAAMPEARWFGAAGVGSDGKIYAFGGYVLEQGSPVAAHGIGRNSLVIYDPVTNTWTRGPEVPKFTRRNKGTYLRGNRISALTPQPYEHRIPVVMPYEAINGAADGQGRVHWFGTLGSVFFDPGNGQWQQTVPLYDDDAKQWLDPIPPFWRNSAATATGPDGRIYRIGGGGMVTAEAGGYHPELLATVDVYDATTGAWQVLTPMQQARQISAAAFGADGKLYVFGGYGGPSWGIGQLQGESDETFAARFKEFERLGREALRSVEVYDPATNHWSWREPMPVGVEGAAAGLGADGRIYVVGGTISYSNPVARREVQVYDPAADHWSEGPAMNETRQGHMVVATKDGRIYAIGGTNAHQVFHPRMIVGGPPAELGSPLASVEVLETKPSP
jgi:N-acetylneuraminic acid mutarotase